MKLSPYLARTLSEGEQVKYQGKVHPAYYLQWVPLFLILEAILYYVFVYNFSSQGHSGGPLPFIVLPLPFLIFLQPFFAIKTTVIALTNQRVITKTGFFTQRTSELLIGQVESVGIEEPFFGRMLGYGTIAISGTGSGVIPIDGIVDPISFRKALQAISQSD